MAKFNTKSQTTKTKNLAGGDAFKISSKAEFASILLTSFVENQFYRSKKGTLTQLGKLMDSIPDKKFLAKAAIYARDTHNMRSISHVVAAEIFKLQENGKTAVDGEQWPRRFVEKVVVRPDDMLEILSYYYTNVAKNGYVANPLKRGLRAAIAKFDEYQLAKYRGANKTVSLVDIVNLVHPTPTQKNRIALRKLINNTLRATETKESMISAAGQGKESQEEVLSAKKEVWQTLVGERKIGYMALVKSLKKIATEAPEMIDEAINMLVDENLIKKSRLLPFRFSTAIDKLDSVNNAKRFVPALNNALDLAVQNVPVFEGETLVVLDESGSMGGNSNYWSTDNPKDPYNIGSLFAALLIKKNNADFIGFSDHAKYRVFNPNDSVLTIRKQMKTDRVNGGTNLGSVFQTINKKYDRIIILSDMQSWKGYGVPSVFGKYKTNFSANPFIYSFDLSGYGSLQMPENQVFLLTGFSDKVFDVMSLLETDKQALVHEIEKIEL